MEHENAQHHQQPELDIWSRFFLRGIAVLDEYGAWTWNLRTVAAATTLILGCVRLVLQKKRGIDWYAWIHAVVSTAGSFVCLYLNYYASESLTGIPEPLRSVQCHGPLTSLHRIVPAITMGYSIFDLYDGLTISFDFVLHGGVTMAVMAFFCEVGAPHILAPMIFMEGSTIFLNMVKADFFPNFLSILNQVCFVTSFFLCRLVIVPIFWVTLVMSMWQNRSDSAFTECFPPYFKYVCFLFGMFYNLLNGYWFYKILKKARRRLLKIERHTDKNCLKESDDKIE